MRGGGGMGSTIASICSLSINEIYPLNEMHSAACAVHAGIRPAETNGTSNTVHLWANAAESPADPECLLKTQPDPCGLSSP